MNQLAEVRKGLKESSELATDSRGQQVSELATIAADQRAPVEV